ncbi:MAG: U32 family peptidase, partial [Fimbriimonadaceae bacterium]|nr:U32 family peptidase [Alphaproteobacteria bacterium]
TLHLPMEMGGPLCFEAFETETKCLDGSSIKAAEADKIADNDKRYDHWRWSKFSRGFTTTKSGYPYGPCGLCAIPELKEMGIEHIKIAGRDGNAIRKSRSLEMVTRIVGQLDAGVTSGDIVSYARNLRGEPELCQNSDMCYYPDMFSRSA